MISLNRWLDTIPKNISYEKLGSEYFFRDPLRPNYQDEDFFFSPADGIVLYAEQAENKLFDIKGRSYTIEDLCGLKFNHPSIIIGIFMTCWDVHVNRIPYSGNLSYKKLNPILTHNKPMIEEEAFITKCKISLDSLDYLFENERVVNRVFASKLGFTYYLVQIADYDIHNITPFDTNQNIIVKQNERFSAIRWGSQVDLVLPVLPNFNYKILVQSKMHIEAGIDKLIKIERKIDCELP